MCFKSAGSAILGGETVFIWNPPNRTGGSEAYLAFSLTLFGAKGQSLVPHRVQLATEFCGWYCILFDLDLNAFVSLEGVWGYEIPGSLRLITPCCLHNSITHTFNQSANIIKPLLRSSWALFWVFRKQRRKYLKKKILAPLETTFY